MNAWPVVCITALAISKLALLMRVSASRHTPTHASGPGRAPRRLRLRDRGEQRVEVRLRVGDAEVEAVGRALAADVPTVPGWSSANGLCSSASYAALPASAEPSP